MDDLNILKNINILEKIEHTNWKIRLEGYNEALNEMSKASNERDPLFDSYTCLMKSMIRDNNAVAQEKALEVVLCFVKEAAVAGKAASDICDGIINKCFNTSRQKTKELAFDILKSTIENEKHDIVIDELIKALDSKISRIIVNATLILKEILHEFGPKILPVRDLLKALPKLFENRDKTVRLTVKELTVEMYIWLGDLVISSLFSQLKPIQVTELNKEFDKVSGKEIKPTRFLKSHKIQENKIFSEPLSQVKDVADIDPFDFLDPVDIISKIPADIYVKLDDKIWTNRKEALEIIDKLTFQVNLVPDAKYGDLIQAILKVMATDCNIFLVQLAAKCLIQLSKGLRKHYSPFALNTIKVCLDRFKVKNSKAIQVFRDCIDFAFSSTSFEACIEDINKSLIHNSPNIRFEATQFLNRIFGNSKNEIYTTKTLKLFMPFLTNLCMDSKQDVRNSAFQSLGTLMKVTTEKKLKPFLDGLDEDKKIRIQEFFSKPLNLTEVQSKSSPKNSRALQPDLNCLNKDMLKLKKDVKFDRKPLLNKQKKINQDCLVKHDNDLISKSATTFVGEKNLLDTPNESTRSINNSKIENMKKVLISKEQSSITKDLNENVDDKKVSEPIVEIDINHNCLWSSKFYEVCQLSEFPDKLIDEELESQQFYQKFKKWNENRIYLKKNQIKRVINNIYNANLKNSTYSLMSLKEMISKTNEIHFQYGSFIAVVLCCQIQWVTKIVIANDLVDRADLGKNIFFNLWHIGQIIHSENLLSSFDDELILLIMVLFLRLVSYNDIHKIFDTQDFKLFIASLAAKIHKITLQKPFTVTAELITIKIMELHLKELDYLLEIEIDGILDKLYNQYIQNQPEYVENKVVL